MKIIERIEREEPANSRDPQLKPRALAIVAVGLIVASLVAGILVTGPMSGAFFIAMSALVLAGRLNYLRGRAPSVRE